MCFAVQLLADRLALDVGHDVKQEPARFAGIKERQDVRVAHRRRGLDLLHEPRGAQHGREFGFQDLDGDLAGVLEILGQIDRRHAPRAELAFDPVTVRQGRRESIRWLGHRSCSGMAFSILQGVSGGPSRLG